MFSKKNKCRNRINEIYAYVRDLVSKTSSFRNNPGDEQE